MHGLRSTTVAHYIFNSLPSAGEPPAALRERVTARLRAGSWDVGERGPQRDAPAPGDLVLIYLGAPDREFVGRAELASTPDGVALTQVEEWDPPVPMSAVLSRIDRSAGARADFETDVVRITEQEYETALAVARERRS